MENGYRLIDANALRCEIDGCSFESGYDCGKVLIMIAEAPTVDAVEVCRCKDCKYSTYAEGDVVFTCNRCNICARPYHFCSYGERREGE